MMFQAFLRIEGVKFTSSEIYKASATNKRDLSDIYVRFIDILFAVVLGQSFVLLNSEEGFKPWLVHPWSNAFGIATLLLVYGLVITSWVGYHRSTRVYPIRNPLRFVIDVLLLFLYYMGFVNAGNFETVNWVFFFVFASYIAWDVFRVVEYRNQKNLIRELLKRLAISIAFAVVFFVSTVSYVYMKDKITGIQWGFFTILLMLLIVYRYVKSYKEPVS